MATKYDYEVWALGYDKDYMCTDIEEFLGHSSSPEAAITLAKSYDSIDKIFSKKAQKDRLIDGDVIHVQVESVIRCTNQQTIYEHDLIYRA